MIAVYETPDGKWVGHYITAFDAKTKNTKPPRELESAKLIISLCKNDMIEMDWDGGREFFRLQKMSAPIDTLNFRLHYTTQKSNSERGTLKSVSSNSFKSTNPLKIEISPIGEVTYVSKQNR